MKIAKIITSRDGPVRVEFYPTKKAANASGNDGHMITGEESLVDNPVISLGMMKDAYNSLAEAPIQRFRDREDGIKRLLKVLDLGGKAPSVAQEAQDDSEATKAPPKQKKQSSASANSSKQPVSLKAGAENPYRVGSKSHSTFETVKDQPGKTIKTYIEEGRRPNTLYHMIKLGLLV